MISTFIPGALAGDYRSEHGLYLALEGSTRKEAKLIFRTLLHSSLIGSVVEELPTSVLAGEYGVLRLLLHHPDELVRSSLVDRLPETKRTASLVTPDLLKDPGRFVRASALNTLWEVGKLSLAAAIEVAEHDRSRWVREKAAGMVVTRFNDESQQRNLNLCLSQDKVVSSLAISILENVIFDELLSSELVDYLRRHFDRVPRGLDRETHESIDYIRGELGLGNVPDLPV